jgi:hypothetical protein
MTLRFCAAAALVLLAAGVRGSTSAAVAAPQTFSVNADAATMADFMKRVADYAQLQKKLDSTLQEVPREARPEQFMEHQRALAKLIQKERDGAKQGDICPKPMRAILRRLLARVFRGPDGRQIKHSILDEYTGHIRLEINGEYPEGIPFATVPPQVLETLPRLPEILEYRFIGERLILLDVHAHVIADYIDRVFP